MTEETPETLSAHFDYEELPSQTTKIRLVMSLWKNESPAIVLAYIATPLYRDPVFRAELELSLTAWSERFLRSQGLNILKTIHNSGPNQQVKEH